MTEKTLEDTPEMGDLFDETSVEDAATTLTLFDVYEVDDDQQENGKWFDDVGLPQVRMKIRRYTSNAAINSRRRLLQGYAKRINKDGTMDPSVERDMQIEQIAASIIVDWEGVQTRKDGKLVDLPCTLENKKMLLRRLPDIRQYVDQLAMSLDNFRRTELGAAEKN